MIRKEPNNFFDPVNESFCFGCGKVFPKRGRSDRQAFSHHVSNCKERLAVIEFEREMKRQQEEQDRLDKMRRAGFTDDQAQTVIEMVKEFANK